MNRVECDFASRYRGCGRPVNGQHVRRRDSEHVLHHDGKLPRKDVLCGGSFDTGKSTEHPIQML